MLEKNGVYKKKRNHGAEPTRRELAAAKLHDDGRANKPNKQIRDVDDQAFKDRRRLAWLVPKNAHPAVGAIVFGE